MKKIIASLVIILQAVICLGQLQIDAGENVVICNFNPDKDSVYLGGNPTIVSGDYEELYWETLYKGPIKDYNASDFIDDTHSPNPRIEQSVFLSDSVYFYLNVKDMEGRWYRDSVLLYASAYTCLDGMDYYINQGDSVKIYADCESFFEPYTYYWKPEYHISDLHSEAPIVWPEKDTFYTVTITDRLGCSLDSRMYIYVTPLDKPNGEETPELLIYPLPANNNSIIQFNNHLNDKKTIQIISTDGKQHLSKKTSDNIIPLSELGMKKGVYIYTVLVKDKIVYTGKIIMEP